MDEYKTARMPVRRAALTESSLLERAKRFERAHGSLVLVLESAAVALGAAGLFSMLCGL